MRESQIASFNQLNTKSLDKFKGTSRNTDSPTVQLIGATGYRFSQIAGDKFTAYTKYKCRAL